MQSRRAVLVFAAVFALAACGDGPSPRERLAAAAEATTGEGTAAFATEADMEMGGEGSGFTMNMAGRGVLDLGSHRGQMSLQVPGMADSMAMVFDSSGVFVRMPAAFSGGEAQWVRQKPGSGGMGAGAGGMGPGAGLGGDPTYLFNALDAVEGEIRDLGSDRVRGTDVRGFGFTVTARSLWGDREELPESMGDLQLPLEAWLDGQNRLRRMVMELDMGAASEALREHLSDTTATEQQQKMASMMSAMAGTVVVTTEFFDFGTDVQVQVPDSSEVVDAEEFERGMMQK